MMMTKTTDGAKYLSGRRDELLSLRISCTVIEQCNDRNRLGQSNVALLAAHAVCCAVTHFRVCRVRRAELEITPSMNEVQIARKSTLY